jgi:hypothetical protein
MKTVIACLVALSFAAGLAGHADAATYRRKKRVAASQYGKQYHYGYRSSDDGYQEQLLKAAPFGSKAWWEIYDRQHGPRG